MSEGPWRDAGDPGRPLHEWARELKERQQNLERRERALVARRAELDRWRARLEERQRRLERQKGYQPSPADDPYFRQARRQMQHGATGPLPVAYAIIAIQVAAFLFDMLIGRGMLLRAGAKVALPIYFGQYYRLLTAVFLHWNIPHLLMNSYAIYLLGPLLERSLGPARFIVLYLMGGLAGSAASLYFRPDTVSVGASGAVFGLFGYLLFTRWRSPLSIPPALNQWITSILMLNLVITILPGTRIDMWGHFGGLAGGFAAGFIVGTPRHRTWPWAGGDAKEAAGAVATVLLMAAFVWLSVSPPFLR